MTKESSFSPYDPLHGLENRLLELTLNRLARIIGTRLAVKGKEGTKVELGLLQELDLADVHLYFR